MSNSSNRKSKSTAPLISVVIPTFNRVKFLFPTLVCLSCQNLEPVEYEVVVIDSGTDRQTPEMFKKFFTRKSFRYIKVKNSRNRSAIRNTGAKAARGNLILFLDNDILVSPNFLSQHIEAHKFQPGILLMTSRRLLHEFDLLTFRPESLVTNWYLLGNLKWTDDERESLFFRDGVEDTVCCQWRAAYSHSMSIGKREYEKVGGFDPAYGDNWGWEDIDFGILCSQAGIVPVWRNDIISYHQPHEASDPAEKRRINDRIALKKHPYFEVEVYTYFNVRFEYYYNSLRPLVDLYYSLSFPHPYREGVLVLGCLESISRPVEKRPAIGWSGAHCQLGIFLSDIGDTSVEEVMLHPVFAHFERSIQLDILAEAVRVSDRLWFGSVYEGLERSLSAVGAIADITLGENNSAQVVIKGRQPSRRWLFLLPDVLNSVDRYQCLAVADSIWRKGHDVTLVEYLGRAKTRADREFQPCHRDFLTTKKIGFIPVDRRITVVPIDVVLEGSFVNNNVTATIFDSRGYVPTDSGLRQGPNWKLAGSAEDVQGHQRVSFGSGFHSECFKPAKSNRQVARYRMVCDLGAQYPLNSVQMLLRGFEIALRTNRDLSLTLRYPDHSNRLQLIYSDHSHSSRLERVAGLSDGWALFLFRLMDTVKALGLVHSVTLVARDMRLDEVSDYLRDFEYYLVPPAFNNAITPEVEALSTGLHLIAPDGIFPSELPGKSLCVTDYSWNSVAHSEGRSVPAKSWTCNWTLRSAKAHDIASAITLAVSKPRRTASNRSEVHKFLRNKYDWEKIGEAMVTMQG